MTPRAGGLLALVLALGGCQMPMDPPVDPGGGLGLATPMKLARPATDIVMTAEPRWACGLFRLVTGQGFCAPIEAPPRRPPYCTRGLAGVDCWNTPDPFGYYQRGLADGPWELPWGLTAAQEWNRLGHWPAPAPVPVPVPR